LDTIKKYNQYYVNIFQLLYVYT